jgi:hypothetical protein
MHLLNYRHRLIVSVLTCVLTVALGIAQPKAGEAVDLELILAVDVSGSVDFDEAELQRKGYLSAMSDPTVIAAIRGGAHRKIAVSYVEWAGLGHYKVVVDWMVISDGPSARAFVKKLAAAPMQRAHRTSISDAIEKSIPRFAENRFDGIRRIIDISGDGANNYGNLVNDARDMAVKAGIVINGLPILSDPNTQFNPTIANLDLFFRDCVIGGPGAFHVVANGFNDFARAIRRKLILEIAGHTPEWRIWRAAERESPPCNAGEWRWMGLMTGGTRE